MTETPFDRSSDGRYPPGNAECPTCREYDNQRMLDLLREGEIAATALETVAQLVRQGGSIVPENCELIAERLRKALSE